MLVNVRSVVETHSINGHYRYRRPRNSGLSGALAERLHEYALIRSKNGCDMYWLKIDDTYSIFIVLPNGNNRAYTLQCNSLYTHRDYRRLTCNYSCPKRLFDAFLELHEILFGTRAEAGLF